MSELVTPDFRFYCDNCANNKPNDNETEILNYVDNNFAVQITCNPECNNCLQKLRELFNENYVPSKINYNRLLLQNRYWYEKHRIFEFDVRGPEKKKDQFVIYRIFECLLDHGYQTVKCFDMDRFLDAITIGTIFITDVGCLTKWHNKDLDNKLDEISGWLIRIYDYDYVSGQHFYVYQIDATSNNIKRAIK